MNYREATVEDIEEMHSIRMSVKENVLVNTAVVTKEIYQEMIESKGKGWVCEIDNKLVGFSIINVEEQDVWALFIDPDYEKKGIGKKLHQLMIDWGFQQGVDTYWLCTEKGTRADSFYTHQGWKNIELKKNGEVKFELTKQEWEERRV